MPKGKIGFEQLNENLQQKIQLGGSGGGGGVGFLKNTVKITANTNTVRIGLYFKPGTDALLVFKNSTYQELTHDYIIDESGKYIKTVSEQWIASEECPVTFNFIVLRTVPLVNSIAANTLSVGFIRKSITVDEDTNELGLDLMYNKSTDEILVFKNSVLMEANIDYVIDMDRQVLVNPNSNWVAGTLLNVIVFKSVPIEDAKFDGAIIEDGSISLEKLSPEFNTKINNIVKDFQTSIDQVIDDANFQTAGGTGTAITLKLRSLKQGYNKTFIAIANNNGAATTINGKPLYKPNTKVAPNIISGKAYSVWYNATSDCFFIKASAEGDALPENVLATKKFSNDNDTGIVGTMPNNGTVNAALNCGEYKIIPKGYHDGNGRITANSLSSQTQANAVANDILNSKTAWVNGIKITGSLQKCDNIGSPDGSGFDSLIGGNATNQYVGRLDFNNLPRKYIEGNMSVHVKDLLPENIKSGIKVGGSNGIEGTFTSDASAQAVNILSGKTAYAKGNKVTGTMPNNGAISGTLNCGESKVIPSGYTTGGTITANSLASQTSATATADKILSGQTAWINGTKITGTMPNKGAVTSSLNAGESYTIPKGYHDGQGKVTANTLYSQTQATATNDKILTGYTAWVNGSKITGTMSNLNAESSITYTNDNNTKVINGDQSFGPISNSDGIDRVLIRYNGKNGFITGNTLIGIPTSNMASQLGITSDKILSGNTICGVSGGIPNRGTYQYGTYGQGDNYIALNNIPWGYYPQSSNGWAPEIRCSFENIRNAIGLTPDKIIKGNTFFGCSGTAIPMQSYKLIFSNAVTTTKQVNHYYHLGVIDNKAYFFFDYSVYGSTSYYSAIYYYDYSNYSFNLLKENPISKGEHKDNTHFIYKDHIYIGKYKFDKNGNLIDTTSHGFIKTVDNKKVGEISYISNNTIEILLDGVPYTINPSFSSTKDKISPFYNCIFGDFIILKVHEYSSGDDKFYIYNYKQDKYSFIKGDDSANLNAGSYDYINDVLYLAYRDTQSGSSKNYYENQLMCMYRDGSLFTIMQNDSSGELFKIVENCYNNKSILNLGNCIATADKNKIATIGLNVNQTISSINGNRFLVLDLKSNLSETRFNLYDYEVN